MSARFLVRFDDMCPTVNWPLWQQLEQVIIDEGISPILAVVPDNIDPALHEGERHERFWDVVRGWQGRGWSIGLHGYQHRYVNRNPGVVGLNHYSEFAGVPIQEQRAINQKLQAFPGIMFNYTQPAEDAVDEAETGLKSALAVKVFGSDLNTLEQKGKAIKQLLEKVRGIRDVTLVQELGQPSLTIKINRAAIARYGLNVDDVNGLITLNLDLRRFVHDLIDHCCDAWNKLEAQPWTIMSIGLRDWAHRF